MHDKPMTESDKEKEMNNQENGAAEAMNINTDENISGTSHLNEPVSQEDEVEKLKREIEELKDKYLRQVAEFENFKKRNAKERYELIQTAGKEVIGALLEVLDDCDRAEKQMQATDDAAGIKEGAHLIFAKLRTILQARGLKAMESIGTDFDPDRHEAITQIPAPSEEMKGKVIDEVQKGYYLNDKLIRHAKVVVGQ
jgi:Molecular chaperone GrpE (heat shock protein)